MIYSTMVTTFLGKKFIQDITILGNFLSAFQPPSVNFLGIGAFKDSEEKIMNELVI